ncbi:MAG: multiple sugar transport system permease protein, partial [Candidatus Hydrogenedentes bacterium]|nr:multiple sugar transport system permease protein [Candidatus Hydrogenedentota bacterium]
MSAERTKREIYQTLIYAGLMSGALLVVGPFLWMLSTSLKPIETLYSFPPQWLPDPPQWDNYTKVFAIIPLGRFFANTIFVTSVVVTLRLIVTTLCAYALARLNFPGKNLFFLGMIATMMIPGEVQLIPGFVMMRWVGWLDTYQVLIVPRIESIIHVFLMRQFFLTIPRDLEEAAIIDGCGHLRIIRHVIVPLSKPVLALVALFAFKAMWNDFMWPLIMTNSTNMKTLQVCLSLINKQQREAGLNLLMAIKVVAFLPILAVFWMT